MDTKKDALNAFGIKLRAILENRKWDLATLASICGVTEQHFLNVMSGQKALTIDLLYLIMEALKLSYEQICDLVSLKVDENAKKASVLLCARRAEKLGDNEYGGTLLFLSEEQLMKKYNNYSPALFTEFVNKYIWETHYKSRIEEASIKKKDEKQDDDLTTIVNNNSIIMDILKTLATASPTDQQYIKESVDLYMKFKKN